MCTIGVAGEKWGAVEKVEWFNSVNHVKRSYESEVLAKLEGLKNRMDVNVFGTLSYDEKYKLYVVTSRNYTSTKPTIVVTGGVHGYETSGVQGALRFAETRMEKYAKYFNIIVFPCVSPWGYETINRWTPKAMDPNRSFSDKSSEEAHAVCSYLSNRKASDHAFNVLAHFDLHETTNSDATTFRPALAARDGKSQAEVNIFIPDGFYLVGNSTQPAPEFQRAIIDQVRKVTHIAPSDSNGCIIGSRVVQEGVINYPAKELGLCMGMTDAAYVTTTEVYPDGATITAEECILAQVTVVTAGLDHLSIGSIAV